MSGMHCSISGVVPTDPVFSKTGYIFERRLIEDHIKRKGTCPITNEPLSESDLQDVKVSRVVKPRVASSSSIPSLLQTFQNEWDSLMVETFELKKQLDSCQLQLATALYKQDAAERTIARLIRERDAARQELRSVISSNSNVSRHREDHGDLMPMDVDDVSSSAVSSISSADLEQLFDNTASTLIARRKTRVVPAETASTKQVSDLRQREVKAVLPNKKTASSLTTVALRGASVFCGASDGSIVVCEASSGKQTALLQGHTGAITGIGFGARDSIVTSSADSTVRLWDPSSGSFQQKLSWTNVHSANVTGVSIHPSLLLAASASADKSWALLDLLNGACVFSVASQEAGPHSCISFHPDGLLIATGTEDSQHSLRLWDVKSRENVISFPGHSGRINSVAFSENGFFMATGSSDQTMKLWDLRQLSSPIFVDESIQSNVSAVAFDYSGEYVAAAGKDVQVYNIKTPSRSIEHLKRLVTGTKGSVSGLAWGTNAKSLFAVSADSLSIFN